MNTNKIAIMYLSLPKRGCSLSIVGKLLGHTYPSIIQQYAHLANKPLRKAAELFGSKIGRLSLEDLKIILINNKG